MAEWWFHRVCLVCNNAGMWTLHAQTKKRRLQLRANMMQPFMCQDPLLAHSGQGSMMP